MSYTIIRGAAHANAMRADKMRALALKLATPLAQLLVYLEAEAAEESACPNHPQSCLLDAARAALADARDAAVVP